MRRAVSSDCSEINRISIAPTDGNDHHQHFQVSHFINQAIAQGPQLCRGRSPRLPSPYDHHLLHHSPTGRISTASLYLAFNETQRARVQE